MTPSTEDWLDYSLPAGEVDQGGVGRGSTVEFGDGQTEGEGS